MSINVPNNRPSEPEHENGTQEQLRIMREQYMNLQKMNEQLLAQLDRFQGLVDPAQLTLQGKAIAGVALSQPSMPRSNSPHSVRYGPLSTGVTPPAQSFAEFRKEKKPATDAIRSHARNTAGDVTNRYGYTPYRGRLSEDPPKGAVRRNTRPVEGLIEEEFNGSKWVTKSVIKSREQMRAEGRARHDAREQFFANQQNRYEAAGSTLKFWNSQGRDGQYFERRAKEEQYARADRHFPQIMRGDRHFTGTDIAQTAHIDNAVARGAVPMHRDLQGNYVYLDNPNLPRPTAGGRDRGELYRQEMGYTPQVVPSASFIAKTAELKREIADANREVLNGSSRMDRVTGAVGEVPFGPRMKITGAGNTPPVVIELWNAENPQRNVALRLNPKSGQFRLSYKNDEAVRLLAEQGLIVTSVTANGSYDVYIQGTKDGSWKFRACNSMDRWSGTETLTVKGSTPARAQRTVKQAIDRSKEEAKIFEEPKRERIQKEAETGKRQPRLQQNPNLARASADRLDAAIRKLDGLREGIDPDTYVAERQKLEQERHRWLLEWEQKQVQLLMRALRADEVDIAKELMKQIEDAFLEVHGTDTNPLAAFRSNNAMQLNRRDIPFQLEVDSANSSNEKLRLLFRKNDGWRTGRKPVE